MTRANLGAAVVALFTLALPGGAFALSAPLLERAAALRDGALQGTRAFEIAHSLTVEVGPRSAGSPGDRAAVEWALRTLRQLGFENVHAEKVTVPHWDRGSFSGEILAPWPQPMVLTTSCVALRATAGL